MIDMNFAHPKSHPHDKFSSQHGLFGEGMTLAPIGLPLPALSLRVYPIPNISDVEVFYRAFGSETSVIASYASPESFN